MAIKRIGMITAMCVAVLLTSCGHQFQATGDLLQPSVVDASYKMDSLQVKPAWSKKPTADATGIYDEGSLAVKPAYLISNAFKPQEIAVYATGLVWYKGSDLTLYIGDSNRRTAATTPAGGAVTYTSSNTAVATVDSTGNVTCKSAGKTVISATSGSASASYNLTVVAKAASTASSSGAAANKTGVFAGYVVTVNDKTTPAVNMRGKTNDSNVMCFVSAADKEVGVISYKDYNAIIDKYKKVVQLEGGGTLGVPPDGRSSWNEWFADEFNKHRGLDTRSREIAVATNNAETIEKYRQELISLVNTEREKAGLSAYVISDECMDYSEIRAKELGEKFSHSRPDETDAGYEIIAVGPMTPEGAVNGWMNSVGHKAAILNENRVYVGAGCFINFNGTIYWQMYFERDPDEYANTLILG